MQDEVNTKVVALAIRTGTQSSKVTAQVLKAAMQKFLAEAEKVKTIVIISPVPFSEGQAP